MMYGSSVPQGSAAPAGPPQSALDAYMANYGARLQSMLSSEAGGGALGGNPVMYQEPTSSLGPDMYQGYRVGEGAPFVHGSAPQNATQPQGQPAQADAAAQGEPTSAPTQAPAAGRAPAGTAPQSALAPNSTPAQQSSALAGRGSARAPASGGAADQSATGQGSPASSAGQGHQNGQQPYGFRDLWNDLSAKQRQQQTDELAAQLKAGRKTIDSAYSDMIGQLGVRPQAGLTRQDKGMLLMEFGLRLMQHSASVWQGGYGHDTGAAIGAAGAETMQQAMGLRQQHEQRAYDYDRLKQQMAIARGRDLSNLQSRSVLEAGRDFRAMNREDALMARSALTQEGAGQRQQSALDERRNQFSQAEAGRNARAAAGREAADARNQARINAPSKGRGAAASSNYQLYIDTYGRDAQGNPLTGAALQTVKEQALNFASDPRHYRLSDAQATQMALTSADRFISSQRENFLGMTPAQVQAKRDEIAAETKQRLLRGGTAGPFAGGGSALTARPPAGTAPASGAPQPTQADLAYLKAHPEKAGAFQRRFGYLPQ